MWCQSVTRVWFPSLEKLQKRSWLTIVTLLRHAIAWSFLLSESFSKKYLDGKIKRMNTQKIPRNYHHFFHILNLHDWRFGAITHLPNCPNRYIFPLWFETGHSSTHKMVTMKFFLLEILTSFVDLGHCLVELVILLDQGWYWKLQNTLFKLCLHKAWFIVYIATSHKAAIRKMLHGIAQMNWFTLR